MKKRLLVCVLSLFLVVGFSLPVSADWVDDSTTDSKLQPYDIKRAKVETYPLDPAEYDEYLVLCMEMKSGGKLPGSMLVGLDVDGDTNTGGGGMFYFMRTCADKPATVFVRGKQQGLDISINVILDSQDQGCPTDWNSNTYGPGDQCFVKDTECDEGCNTDGQDDCWLGNTSCVPIDNNPNCYKAGEMCDQPEPTCDNCFKMDGDQCIMATNVNISYPKDRGEWYAVMLSPPQMNEPYLARGKIDSPLPARGGPNGSETEVCVNLPYRQILTALKSGGSTFGVNQAKDSSNIEWVVTAWEDDQAGGCDYINPLPLPSCVAVVDAVPDNGAGSGQDITTHVELCRGETTQDGIVSGDDLAPLFFGWYEFGCRTEYVQGLYMGGGGSGQIELFFDFDGDGVKDTESPFVKPPPGAGTITVDVWAGNFPPPDSLMVIDFVVHTDATKVSITNVVPSTDAAFSGSSKIGPGAPLPAGDFQIGCVQTAGCPSGATGPVILASFDLTPLVTGQSTITADTTGGVGALGFASCTGSTPAYGQTPTPNSATIIHIAPGDADGDGIPDEVDNCPDDYNPVQTDSDGDRIGDVCDNCPVVYNPSQDDYDGDELGDACDSCTDTDGDGYGNPGFPLNTCDEDNCPDDYNPVQTNSDGDRIGDVCDNCPVDYNPSQTDCDGDFLGDACDPDTTDTDSDGVDDGEGEGHGCDNCPEDYNPDQLDSDNHNGGDICDICPADNTDTCDPDGSGAGVVGESGGEVETPDNSTTIYVPADAVDNGTSFSITKDIIGTEYEIETNLGEGQSVMVVQLESGEESFNEDVNIRFEWEDVDNDGLVEINGEETDINEMELFVTKDDIVITATCKIDANTCFCTSDCSDCRCNLDDNYFKVDVSNFSNDTVTRIIDSDSDGVTYNDNATADNCPDTPNSPDNGTCVKEFGNIIMPIRVDEHTVRCTNNSTCEMIIVESYCQMEQGDINENGVGDACECYADYNNDGIVSTPDLDLFEAQYYQNPCVRTAEHPAPPAPGCCHADGNNDGIVSTPDLDLFEAQYYHFGCPDLNMCPNVP